MPFCTRSEGGAQVHSKFHSIHAEIHTHGRYANETKKRWKLLNSKLIGPLKERRKSLIKKFDDLLERYTTRLSYFQWASEKDKTRSNLQRARARASWVIKTNIAENETPP